MSPKQRIAGFSLVELIVTIAIIGVLSSFAIPFYEKFTFRTKSTEAKVMMSALYSAEKAFYSEYLAFHVMFQAVGFSPEGSIRFNVGFGTFLCDTSTSAGPQNGYNVQFNPFAGGACTTASYCSNYSGGPGQPGNSCFLLQSYGQSVVPLGTGFTVSPTSFVIGATIGAPTELVTSNQKYLDRMQAIFQLNQRPAIAMSPAPIHRTITAVGITLSSEKKFNEVKCTYATSNSWEALAVGPNADVNGNPFCLSLP